MRVLVVDYGMSNLGSIRRALEECGGDVTISQTPSALTDASSVVLPGVGAFGDGARRLRESGWREALHASVGRGIPLLGICLGMQLLATRGFEGEESEGLDIIPGEVRRMIPLTPGERLPHVGWNELRKTPEGERSPLLAGIPDASDFYFVHSYHFAPESISDTAARTPYCGGFSSVLARGRCFGVQFHPEKSGHYGFQLLRNFLSVGVE